VLLLSYVKPVTYISLSVRPVTSIVKFGYVPVTLMFDPLFKTTVWSGKLFSIVKLGYVPPVNIPVPPLNVTVWSGSVFIIVILPVVVSADKPTPVVNEFT
jgi:hypothetical protein